VRYISEMQDSDVIVWYRVSFIPTEYKQIFHSAQQPVTTQQPTAFYADTIQSNPCIYSFNTQLIVKNTYK